MLKEKAALQSILKDVKQGRPIPTEELNYAVEILDNFNLLPARAVISHSLRAPFRRQGTNTKVIIVKPHQRKRVTPNEVIMLGVERKYYSVQDVAELFKVSDKAVYKWIKLGKIDYDRSGDRTRDIRIPKSQFKSAPSRETTDEIENKVFHGAVEMELVRRKRKNH